MERVHVIFRGRVQGVWFRANCQKKAVSLDLKGWVKNLPDGTVECVAEGPRKDLELFVEWCSNNQPMAKVTGTDLYWEVQTGEFREFRIIR
ncbi:MAG: acylphosphatase [Thermoplasmatota archaeon]